MKVEIKLYLTWLIPSTLSFISSLFVIFYILYLNPKLRVQLYHQLTLILAVADIVQSGCWFAGVKFTASYTKCAVQEYMLQAGALYKAFATIIISGVASYTVIKTESPKSIEVFYYGSILMIIPSTCVLISIVLKSSSVFCYDDIAKYTDASHSLKISILAYYFSFQIFVYICALVDIILFIFIIQKLQEIKKSTLRLNATVSIRSQPSYFNNSVVTYVTRLMLYPACYVIGWLPNSFSLMAILITGKDLTYLTMLANVSAGLTGLAISLCYLFSQQHLQASHSVGNNTRHNNANNQAVTSKPGRRDQTVGSATDFLDDPNVDVEVDVDVDVDDGEEEVYTKRSTATISRSFPYAENMDNNPIHDDHTTSSL